MEREPTTPPEQSALSAKPWEDPEWRVAVEEVDDSLLDWFLSLTPFQRLEAATKATRALSRFVHEPSERA